MITTTTADTIFEDDETRFLSLWVDQSERQTRAILRSELESSSKVDARRVQIVQYAVEMIRVREVTVELPEWFKTISKHIPATVRSRRAWPRALSFCKAIALIRFCGTNKKKTGSITVDLSDYAVAYRLLNRAFSNGEPTAGPSTLELVEVVKKLFRKNGKAVSVNDVARVLRWKAARTYKHARTAKRLGFLRHESSDRRNNRRA